MPEPRDLVASLRALRRRADLSQRDATGQRRWEMFTGFRLLGPHDRAVLAVLRADATRFDLAGRPAAAPAPTDEAQDLRYLRDPAVRHVVAEDRGRILGDLLAHLQMRHDRAPSLLVTDLGLLVV